MIKGGGLHMINMPSTLFVGKIFHREPNNLRSFFNSMLLTKWFKLMRNKLHLSQLIGSEYQKKSLIFFFNRPGDLLVRYLLGIFAGSSSQSCYPAPGLVRRGRAPARVTSGRSSTIVSFKLGSAPLLPQRSFLWWSAQRMVFLLFLNKVMKFLI